MAAMISRIEGELVGVGEGRAELRCGHLTYMLLVPALAVSSLILGFNLMADGLREMSLRD